MHKLRSLALESVDLKKELNFWTENFQFSIFKFQIENLKKIIKPTANENVFPLTSRKWRHSHEMTSSPTFGRVVALDALVGGVLDDGAGDERTTADAAKAVHVVRIRR